MSNIIKPFSFKMARGRLLNDLRKDQIIAYCSDGLGLRAMSRKIKRSKCVKKFSRQNGNNCARNNARKFSRRARLSIWFQIHRRVVSSSKWHPLIQQKCQNQRFGE